MTDATAAETMNAIVPPAAEFTPSEREASEVRAAVDAAMRQAKARRPDGGAMLRHRHGIADGAVWVVSARLGSGMPVALARSGLALPEDVDPDDEALLYWIGHAVRQDVERALAGARSWSLAIGVEAVEGGVAVTVAVFGRAVPARGRLDRAIAPARLARHRGWAIARSRVSA